MAKSGVADFSKIICFYHLVIMLVDTGRKIPDVYTSLRLEVMNNNVKKTWQFNIFTFLHKKPK